MELDGVEPTFVIQTARKVLVPWQKGALISVKLVPQDPVLVTYSTPGTSKKIERPAPSPTRGRGQVLKSLVAPETVTATWDGLISELYVGFPDTAC